MTSKGRSSSIQKAVAARLAQPKHRRLLSEWEKAYHRLQSDPEGAITAARSLIETTCKHILDETGRKYSSTEDLPKLYSIASAELGIAPAGQADRLFKSIFGAAHTVVQCVGELRNRLGDSHGKGKSSLVASRAQAELAVNLAGSVICFLSTMLENYLAATRKLNSNGEAILKFDKALVWRLIDHARNARRSRKSYGERRARPALWLVGDAGVYLMSNGDPPISHKGKMPKGKEQAEIPYLTAPAEGCDPRYDEIENWWPIHNAIAEGSDFCFTIPLRDIEPVLSNARSHIVIVANEKACSIYPDVEYTKVDRY